MKAEEKSRKDDVHLTVVDDFGHQCHHAGTTHLYTILEIISFNI